MTYFDLFLSPWTLLAAAVTAAAFITLIIGRYPWKTIIRTTAMCLVLSYALSIAAIYQLQFGEQYHRQQVLDRQHDFIQTQRPSELANQRGLIIAVSAKETRDGFVNRIYLGHYGEQPLQEGRLVLRLFDENGRPLGNETLTVSQLLPGEQLTLTDLETSAPVDNYQYQWTFPSR